MTSEGRINWFFSPVIVSLLQPERMQVRHYLCWLMTSGASPLPLLSLQYWIACENDQEIGTKTQTYSYSVQRENKVWSVWNQFTIRRNMWGYTVWYIHPVFVWHIIFSISLIMATCQDAQTLYFPTLIGKDKLSVHALKSLVVPHRRIYPLPPPLCLPYIGLLFAR